MVGPLNKKFQMKATRLPSRAADGLHRRDAVDAPRTQRPDDIELLLDGRLVDFGHSGQGLRSTTTAG